MKKIKFISALALTMVLASCENYELPNPPGQTSEDAPAFQTSNLVIEAPESLELNLVAANEANTNVEVAKIAELKDFPADYELKLLMELGSDDNFSKSTTVETIITDNVVYVNPDALNGAVQAIYTKEPGKYSLPAKFQAYAVRENTQFRLGGFDYTYCPETLNITTLNPDKVLEQSYYLVPCDAKGNPNMSKAVKMENTAKGDVSVYDNPEFAVKIDVPEEAAESESGYLWKLAPKSAVDGNNTVGVLGCKASADNELQGKLGEGYEAGGIHLQGPVLVAVNVEEDSYSINYALEFLYVENNKPQDGMQLYSGNYINYQGVAYVNQVFYLYGQDSKDGVQFKQDPDVEPVVSENGLTQTGILTPASTGKQFVAPVKGKNLYWFDVNLVQREYSITCLQTLTVIGSHNGWDLETAIPLTPSKDFRTWTATGVELTGEFKINANGAWDIDFGGSVTEGPTGLLSGEINYKGGNIQANGKYDITVSFAPLPYTIQLEKK